MPTPAKLSTAPVSWQGFSPFLEAAPAFPRLASSFLFVGATGFLVILFFVAPEQVRTARGLGPFCLALTAVVARLLLWRGQAMLASLLLIVGTWVYVTLISILVGGLNSVSIFLYPPVIMMAGWRLGQRYCNWLAGLSVAACLGYFLAEYRGALPSPSTTPNALRLMVQVLVFIFSAVLTNSLVRTYRQRLQDVNQLSERLTRRTAELERGKSEIDRAQAVGKVGSWTYDIVPDALRLSVQAQSIFGMSENAEGNIEAYMALVHPQDRNEVQQIWRAALKGASFDHEHRLVTGKRTVWVRHKAEVELDGHGQPLRAAGIVQVITERKLAEERLQLAASVFLHALEGIMITAIDGTIIDVNSAFGRITGYQRDEVLGANPRLLSSGHHDKAFYDALWASLAQKGYWFGEIWNRRKNGEVFATMQTISTVRDSLGMAQQYVSLFSDISNQKAHERQIEHIAHYDALTKLPNRVLLSDRMHQGIAQVARRGGHLAVGYLDLDGFKGVNDQHGHETGDQLLMTLAARMKDALREGDTLARLGGDEFVAVMFDLPDIEASVPMLTRLLGATAQPVHIGPLTLQVSASLGVSFYPQVDEVDPDQLLRQADQAMYQAKLAGKNRYHVFDAEQDRSVRGQHESLEQVRLGLQRREFLLYYQPKVNMRTGAMIGVEALIRWQHPQRGLLAPIAFLPVIEDHSLAVEVGNWVIETALSQLEVWQSEGLDFPVSVNIGARQLSQTDFADQLRQSLCRHPKVKAGQLELEVLETSALEDLTWVSQLIATCRDMGVWFALDDFGTGYSSLTYLKHLRVAQLKIDQSFVRDMLEDPEDLAILEGVLGLASAFRCEVIAEGVETVAHGEMLLQLGCELAQGFGIARPMPAQLISGWAATWRTDPIWSNCAPIGRAELPILFASVEHRAWIANLERYLSGEAMAPPALDNSACRFAKWAAKEGTSRFGASSAFLELLALHERVHAFGADLCECHLRNERVTVERLGELQALSLAMLSQMHNLLSNR